MKNRLFDNFLHGMASTIELCPVPRRRFRYDPPHVSASERAWNMVSKAWAESICEFDKGHGLLRYAKEEASLGELNGGGIAGNGTEVRGTGRSGDTRTRSRPNFIQIHDETTGRTIYTIVDFECRER